jgi:hypothetical protein
MSEATSGADIQVHSPRMSRSLSSGAYSRDPLAHAGYTAAVLFDRCLTNCERKLPDGQISKNLSSPSRKNIPLHPSGKSSLQARPVSPEKGRIMIVTNARWDAMDATASGAQRDRRAGLPVSDRPARGRTMLQPVFARTRRDARGPARPLAKMVADGEVVWSWRPDAGVKSCGDASGPTGFEMYRQSAGRRWQESPVTGESTK